MGTLYLVATPIGNLEDITLRALRILREVDLIAAEDTRQTKKLLHHYEIGTPLLSYHEYNKEQQIDHILKALEEGDVALVSDAGTPGLSDPGFELIRAVMKIDHLICPIPGPSAPITALIASGLPTDAFLFLGYLPRRASERKRALQSVADVRHTIIFFEVPHRLNQTLEEVELILGGDRQMACCRELTKIHEEVLRGTVVEIKTHFKEVEPKGEFTIVVTGASLTALWDKKAIHEAIRIRRDGDLSLSEIARQVAQESGWRRQDVYRIALEEK